MIQYSHFDINHYSSHFQNRNTRGGDVTICLHKKFPSLSLHKFFFSIASHNLSLKVTQHFRFIVGIIYRLPNAKVDEFLLSIEYIVESLVGENLPCYIMGLM